MALHGVAPPNPLLAASGEAAPVVEMRIGIGSGTVSLVINYQQ